MIAAMAAVYVDAWIVDVVIFDNSDAAVTGQGTWN
jgi:hypothetical protein